MRGWRTIGEPDMTTAEWHAEALRLLCHAVHFLQQGNLGFTP